MNAQRPNPEELFDRAVEAVRSEPIDPQVVAAARERVARRLRSELDAPAEAGAPEHRIRGCDGFRSLIPAYLAGALAEPRRILFEDHTRECVPCRRALADARRGGAAGAGWQARRERPAAFRYALAAGLAGLVIAGAAVLSGRLGWIGPDASARVRAIEGELVALDGGTVRPVAAGAALERGDTVRTGSGSGAVVELADGSRVELAARSQLTLARRGDGVVLDLERGALIVEAAGRKRGHLYVRTDDCLVSVVGTIFSVNHGVRGSRVSVLDGEVHVDGVRRAVLRPGDQIATSAQLGRVSLEQEISWSRNAEAYRDRIAALAALGREIDATLAIGGRTSTALVDRAPAGTAIWVGLPNVADELSDAWALVEQRVTENPALAAWWSERFSGGEAAKISDALAHLRDFGSHLGDEIAVAVGVDATGEPFDPVVFAEVADARGFDELVDAEIARLNAEAGAARIVRVDDPSQVAAADGTLFLWRSADGLFAASPSPARLAELAGGGFAGSALHGRLVEIYRDGTGWLVGVDAARILAGAAAHEAGAGAAFAALGLADAEHFLLESETVAGATEMRAALAFAGSRRGAVAWLAAPAPSGALEFVSPAASLVVAGISKRPAEMFDDLMALARAENGGETLAELARAESQLGFSLRDDVAAALGGDAAFALDGPLLPKPSWKAIVEVVDPSRLEYALGRAVEAIDREAAAQGRPGLRFGQEEVDGRRYLTLATDSGVALAAMSFVDGYLVAAPSRALVVEAIALRDAGTHLVASRAFRDLLPSDAETDFSALAWQNFGGVAGPLGDLLSGALPAEEREQIAALAQEVGPTLVLAYGDADRVRFVSRGGTGPLGLSFEKLLAVAGALRQPAPETEEANETPTQATA